MCGGQGWAGVRCDSDIDECSSNPCSGDHELCVNTPGSYKCICQDGYTRGEHDICTGKELTLNLGVKNFPERIRKTFVKTCKKDVSNRVVYRQTLLATLRTFHPSVYL